MTKQKPQPLIAPILIGIVILIVAVILQNTKPSDIAADQLISEANSFDLNRRFVLYNSVSNECVLSIEGYFSIHQTGRRIDIILNTGLNEYQNHLLFLSRDMTYFCEQLKPADKYHHKITYRPTRKVP